MRLGKGRRYSGLILMALALGALLFVNRFTLKEEVLTFESAYKDRVVQLEATLYSVPDAEYAVLICSGYSCDRQKWEPFANGLVANGTSVMMFDYSGQGASGGTIGFDNAKTDWIPVAIDDAIEALHRRTGIPEDHIILLGHSMGGRAILRLMADYHRDGMETRVQPREIRNLILLSPEVNYQFSAQASLFAGTRDDRQEPWMSYSEKDIQGVNVYLFGSTADDVVSDGCIHALAKRLGVVNGPDAGTGHTVQTNASGSRVTVTVTDGVLHSYQMYSPRFAHYANEALAEITGRENRYAGDELYLVYAGWLLALVGLTLLMSGLTLHGPAETEEKEPVLLDARRFLRVKLGLWIPGVVMAFMVCSLCVVIPFGSPIMNIPYMCFISGYGLVMLLAYRKGRFAGTEGKLPGWRRTAGTEKGKRLSTLLIIAGISAYIWLILRLSMYRLVPINARLFWLIFATALMIPGFYISGVENTMLRRAGAGRKIHFLYGLIQYIPLILFVLFYLVIRSYSGLIGQILNVLLMYILFVPMGHYLQNRTGNRLAGALITSFLFQAFMITSAALIALF